MKYICLFLLVLLPAFSAIGQVETYVFNKDSLLEQQYEAAFQYDSGYVSELDTASIIVVTDPKIPYGKESGKVVWIPTQNIYKPARPAIAYRDRFLNVRSRDVAKKNGAVFLDSRMYDTDTIGVIYPYAENDASVSVLDVGGTIYGLTHIQGLYYLKKEDLRQLILTK